MTAARTAVAAPHPLAREAGAAVLAEGGSAVEAAVAAAAVCAVALPHHAGLGGDGVWMLSDPADTAPAVIESVGRAGAGCSAQALRAAGLEAVPERGPRAVLTPPGTVAGWAAALAAGGGALPRARLLEPARTLAVEGVPVPGDLGSPPDGAGEVAGGLLRQPVLAATLERLAAAGLADLYTGDLAAALAEDLAAAGSPLSAADLAAHAPRRPVPLRVASRRGLLWAPPPPSRGLAVLMMLGLLERLPPAEPDGFDHLHGVIEAAKQAALVCDAVLDDPAAMAVEAATLLSAADLAMRASDIVPNLALGWPVQAAPGDTVGIAAVDAEGRIACTMQSLGAAFGSAVASPATGLVLHDRGRAFALADDGPRALAPGWLPVHGLCPVLGALKDGRRLAAAGWGAGAGPQAAAQVLVRVLMLGAPPALAVAAPRVRLGATDVTVPPAVDDRVTEGLRAAGHAVRTAPTGDAALLATVNAAGAAEAACSP